MKSKCLKVKGKHSLPKETAAWNSENLPNPESSAAGERALLLYVVPVYGSRVLLIGSRGATAVLPWNFSYCNFSYCNFSYCNYWHYNYSVGKDLLQLLYLFEGKSYNRKDIRRQPNQLQKFLPSKQIHPSRQLYCNYCSLLLQPQLLFTSERVSTSPLTFQGTSH